MQSLSCAAELPNSRSIHPIRDSTRGSRSNFPGCSSSTPPSCPSSCLLLGMNIKLRIWFLIFFLSSWGTPLLLLYPFWLISGIITENICSGDFLGTFIAASLHNFKRTPSSSTPPFLLTGSMLKWRRSIWPHSSLHQCKKRNTPFN